jgi:type I restriction enzyme S subunit
MEIEIPFFPLKEIGRIVKREIRLEPNGEYKTVGCKLYGLGVYERETKGGSNIQAKRMFLIEENDFLINRIWAQKGSAGIVPPELEGAVVTNDFPVIELDLTRVYPPYISWYVKTRKFWETCRKHSHGTSGRERLSPKELPNIEIPLPDLEEQKRIVTKIESLMARIEEARRLRKEAVAELEEAFLAELKNIFSNDSIMQVTKKVSEICTKPQYGYTDSAKEEPIGPKFVRITDIRGLQINWEQVPYSSCPEKEKYLLKSGDILVARTGAPGKSFLVKSPPESIFASYLVRIKPQEGILSEYMHWFFQSPPYWSQVIEKTRGTAQLNMNGKKLSNIQVPLPCSEETQHRIVAYLDSLQAKVDELKMLQAETEKELEELVPSILDKAFKGEL